MLAAILDHPYILAGAITAFVLLCAVASIVVALGERAEGD